MYPMRCDNVQLLICEDEFGTKSYYAVNVAGEEFSVSYPVFKALRQADGTRPLRLPEDDVDLLAELENDGLVHTSRLVREESCSRLILFTFGKERVRKVRPGCKVLNAVLPVGAVLTLVAGIAIRILHVLSDGVDMDSFNLLLYVGLLVASAVLHELAHLWAAISYGFPVFEAGVLVENVFGICLYVAHGRKPGATKAEEIQVALAGIEANMFAMGLFMIVSVLCEAQSTTFYAAAAAQIGLIVSNLIPSKGIEVDGEVALNTLFEVKSIYDVARKWTGSKRRRRKLIRSAGLPGAACIALFRVIVFANEMHLMWNAIVAFGPVLLVLRN